MFQSPSNDPCPQILNDGLLVLPIMLEARLVMHSNRAGTSSLHPLAHSPTDQFVHKLPGPCPPPPSLPLWHKEFSSRVPQSAPTIRSMTWEYCTLLVGVQSQGAGIDHLLALLVIIAVIGRRGLRQGM